MKKYDDASWHNGAEDFPEDLPPSAGATSSGMFFAWAIFNDLCSDEHLSSFPDEVALLKDRKTTPGQYLFETLDGKLCDADLNSVGNSFAMAYFDISVAAYSHDYFEVVDLEEMDEYDVGEFGSPYLVRDSWENYDLIALVVTERFNTWRKEHVK